MLDLTLVPSFKVKRWFTFFGELSFQWIQFASVVQCVGLVRFWGYPVTTVAMTTQDFQVLQFVGVPQTKPLHGFHQIFRICLPQDDLELIRFWGVSGNNCCHGNTFNIFGS